MIHNIDYGEVIDSSENANKPLRKEDEGLISPKESGSRKGVSLSEKAKSVAQLLKEFMQKRNIPELY